MTSLKLPLDALQVTEDVAPPIVPARVIGCVEQAAISAPAFTVAAGKIVIIIESDAGPHGPAGSTVVNVKVTLGNNLSAADGVYVVLRFDALANVPVPLVVQVDEVTPVPLRVPEIATFAVLVQ